MATVTVTEAEMLSLLRDRYPDQAYAFLPHVPAGTGGYAYRTADAVVMGTWPSRGLELHGFEIKVSRTDWLRELANPAKAEAIASYMDRWWMVISEPRIVMPGELPPLWGLLVKEGSHLVCRVDAPKLDPVALDRRFLAAILRVASRQIVGEDEIRKARNAGYAEGRSQGIEEGKAQAERAHLRDSDIRRAVAAFEESAGFKIETAAPWSASEQGEVIRWALDHVQDVGTIRRWFESMERSAKAITERLDGLEWPGKDRSGP